METLTQIEISTYDEARKLLRLIIATWPNCDLSTIEVILKDATRCLKLQIEKEINKRQNEIYQTAIKNLITYLDL